MYSFLVACFTAILGVGFWFDNAISHSVYQYWWVLLVAGYLILCLQLPGACHRFINRGVISAVVVVSVLLSIWLFDDVMTIYVSGLIYLAAWGIGCYTAAVRKDQSSPLNKPVIALVALTLISLPVSVNRILIKLPNLTAGTAISLYESEGATPDLDARFYNGKNDHLEIEVSLGSQIYFEQPHEAPRLRFETTIPDVVVRLLSVSYQHRLAYLDLPLFELTIDELLQLKLTDDGAAVDMARDRVFLLLTGFKVGEPVWIQLPHMQSHEISMIKRAVIVVFRLLLWLLICFAITVWLPRSYRVEKN